MAEMALRCEQEDCDRRSGPLAQPQKPQKVAQEAGQDTSVSLSQKKWSPASE